MSMFTACSACGLDVCTNCDCVRKPLESRVAALRAEIVEWEQSFELHNKAAMALMHAYKRAHPEVPENVWPDVTKVNVWAAERIDSDRSRAVAMRGVSESCTRCAGLGVYTYGSTATWRGGVGGAMMTTDVCDKCWGSGDAIRSGANLRLLYDRVETLQRVMQVLGPSVPDDVDYTDPMNAAGLIEEQREALRLLRTAGIEYKQRKRRTD